MGVMMLLFWGIVIVGVVVGLRWFGAQGGGSGRIGRSRALRPG
jgi:hypothetical protein